MKTVAILLPLLTLAMVGYAGETNQIGLQRDTPVQQSPSGGKDNLMTVPRTNALVRPLNPEVTYGGVLPELKRRKTRFFKASPTPLDAPFQNVSVNPITGRADGVIVFSIGF
jgi:hypothetical protein